MMFDDPMAVSMTMKMLLLEWVRQDGAQVMRAKLDNLLGSNS